MISKFLKILAVLALVSTVGIFVVFSIWDAPVKQEIVEVDVNSSDFIK